LAAGLWAAFGAAADFEQVRAVALQGAAVGLKGDGDVTLAGRCGVTVEGLPQGLVDVDIIDAVVGSVPMLRMASLTRNIRLSEAVRPVVWLNPLTSAHAMDMKASDHYDLASR